MLACPLWSRYTGPTRHVRPFEGRVAQRESTSLTSRGSQVRSLSRPPSSLCKPHDSGTTLNRAFLRGFPATHFADFGLCRRSRILAAILGALSLHPEIPFPAAGIEPEVQP